MDFERKLADLVADANGVFTDIKWGTMRGAVFTLGTMSNDHVANSRHYHKHMAEVARVTPELNIPVDDCKFNQYLMSAVIAVRRVTGTWDIDEKDFRLI